jgi:micrococcal nuclease
MARPRAVVIVAVLAAASLGGWRLGSARPPRELAVVVAVLDGDTVAVDWRGRRQTVRLLGVDTPETMHPERAVECYGPEAASFTRRLLLGRPVELAFDRVRQDRYGRVLAYAWLDGRRFNDRLLAEGYARLMVIPPNDTHARALLRAELEARRTGRGLWGAC